MQTNNLISTPNISGNIGSCKTEIAHAVTDRPSLFYTNTVDIATNSCTGEVTAYNSWEMTPFTVIVGMFVFLVAVIPLCVWADSNSY